MDKIPSKRNHGNVHLKKFAAACLSGVLSLSFYLVGFPAFQIDNVAFAEDETAETLVAGTYSATLYNYLVRRYGNPSFYGASNQHFSGKAIVEVDDSGKTSISFGVENWSLYDCFIPNKQTDVLFSNKYVPASILNSENDTYIKHYDVIKTSAVVDNSDDMYLLSDYKNKFGNIKVEYDSQKDYAYVTIPIEKADDYFAISSVFNTTIGTSGNYVQRCYLKLDTDTFTKLDDSFDKIEEWNFTTECATRFEINSDNRAGVFQRNYNGEETSKKVFDYGELIANNDGSYLAKLHVSDITLYNSFRILDQVSYNNEDTWYNWDIKRTGLFEEISVDENGYIAIDYNSIEDVELGKFIYFDTDNSDDYEYYCSVSWSPKAIVQYDFTDSSTGINITADSTVFPSLAGVKVEVNKSFEDDPKSDQFDKYTSKWTSSLFTDPIYYTISLIDNDGNKIESDKQKCFDVTVPIPDDFDLDKYFYDIIDNEGGIMCHSDNSEAQNASVHGVIIDYDNHLLKINNCAVNGYTIAIMKKNSRSNVYALDIPESGMKIYEANAFFMHKFMPNTSSMA